MNCRSSESLFSAFLDDELSQAERRDFESHLLGCRRCSQSLREFKSMMSLVADTAVAVETSPHFEDDVMDRIRSGEAMRPTVIEWLHGLLSPERLRPAFMVGAGACAVFIATLLFNPKPIDKSTLVATNDAKEPAATTSFAPTPVASVPTPAASTTQAPVTVASRVNDTPRVTAPSNGGNGIVEIADRVIPSKDAADSDLQPNPQFTDEYVTDQFFLQRGQTSSDPQQPSLVPVTDKTANGVYIEF